MAGVSFLTGSRSRGGGRAGAGGIVVVNTKAAWSNGWRKLVSRTLKTRVGSDVEVRAERLGRTSLQTLVRLA